MEVLATSSQVASPRNPYKWGRTYDPCRKEVQTPKTPHKTHVNQAVTRQRSLLPPREPPYRCHSRPQLPVTTLTPSSAPTTRGLQPVTWQLTPPLSKREFHSQNKQNRPFPSELVSWGCWDQWPQAEWLKATQTHALTVLGVGGPE